MSWIGVVAISQFYGIVRFCFAGWFLYLLGSILAIRTHSSSGRISLTPVTEYMQAINYAIVQHCTQSPDGNVHTDLSHCSRCSSTFCRHFACALPFLSLARLCAKWENVALFLFWNNMQACVISVIIFIRVHHHHHHMGILVHKHKFHRSFIHNIRFGSSKKKKTTKWGRNWLPLGFFGAIFDSCA